ncbi:MAG TPA: hypothetical protein VKQ07_02060 [Jatrophihabitantaceae bacterium]|nr:hypothetical protein [Jatrophihabitantaceae bacterium]
MNALHLAVYLAGENQKSGPIGFAVILVLCVACYFLFKSMSKHLRKVREQYPPDAAEGEPDQPPAQPPVEQPVPDDPGTPST